MWELPKDLPNKKVFFVDLVPLWMLFFDEATRKCGVGVGVVFFTPHDEAMPFSFTLKDQCLNNMAEYKALIINLEMALDIQVHQLEVFRDSKLIANQLLKEYDVWKPDLIPYFQYTVHLFK